MIKTIIIIIINACTFIIRPAKIWYGIFLFFCFNDSQNFVQFLDPNLFCLYCFKFAEFHPILNPGVLEAPPAHDENAHQVSWKKINFKKNQKIKKVSWHISNSGGFVRMFQVSGHISNSRGFFLQNWTPKVAIFYELHYLAFLDLEILWPPLLPEAISSHGSSTVQNQEFRFWGGSCVGFFGPKGVFWCKDNVQKVS